MVSPCWETQTSAMETGWVLDWVFGLIHETTFGQVSEQGLGDQNLILVSEIRNRRNMKVYAPELVAGVTLREPDLVEVRSEFL